MNGTISEIESEIIPLLRERGPMPIREISEHTDYYPNDILFGLLQSDKVITDDTGRFRLRG